MLKKHLIWCSRQKHMIHSCSLSSVPHYNTQEVRLESDVLPAPWLTTIIQHFLTSCLAYCRSLLAHLPVPILTGSKVFNHTLDKVMIFSKSYHNSHCFDQDFCTSQNQFHDHARDTTASLSSSLTKFCLIHFILDTLTLLLSLRNANVPHTMAFALAIPSSWNAHLWELSFLVLLNSQPSLATLKNVPVIPGCHYSWFSLFAFLLIRIVSTTWYLVTGVFPWSLLIFLLEYKLHESRDLVSQVLCCIPRT